MLQACFRVNSKPSLPKPNPPQLKEIKVGDVDCLKDSTLCDIVNNFELLLKYICQLEANPSWVNDKVLCNLNYKDDDNSK